MKKTGTNDTKSKEGLVEVFTAYITIKGKRIYAKNGKCFHFWAKPKTA